MFGQRRWRREARVELGWLQPVGESSPLHPLVGVELPRRHTDLGRDLPLERLPDAVHVLLVLTSHGQQGKGRDQPGEARLRPMRGLKQDRSARG
jgi:hypothetical protein